MRRAFWTYAWLVLALSLVAGGPGRAQQLVAGVGTVDPAMSASVDQTEFVLCVPRARAEAIAARHGLTIVRELPRGADGVFLVRGSATRTRDEIVTSLMNDTEVDHFELNGLAVLPEIPSGITLNQSPVYILDVLSAGRTLVDFYGKPTWLRYVNQPATTAIRLADTQGTLATGAGIVAIIDTGVDPNHPLLKDSLVPGYDFVSDVAGQASEWTDLDPATTTTLDQSPVYILDQSPVYILDQSTKAVPLNQSTVALLSDATAQALDPTALPVAFGHGTMVAGLVHLVAPTAKIMPLKAFRADGSSRLFDVVRAIYYAVEHGAQVINMSFSTAEQSPEITHAINYATENGVICVASAGNSGKDLLVYPAALRSVIGIGSTTDSTPPRRSSFSNYGNSLVRMGAPGEGVITTYPGNHYVAGWGTSFSTPLVAGAAALLLQRDPTMDASGVNHLLGKAADQMAGERMGRGRLNLFKAIADVPDTTPPTIAFVTPSSGAALRNTVPVTASASDNINVLRVRFLRGTDPLGPDDTAAPFEMAWDTRTVPNGAYALMAIAYDGSGNATSSSVNVTVENDATPPAVTITAPGAGASIGGTVTIAADATDDIEVASVQFFVDGVALGAADPAAPFEAPWPTLSAANGAHTLTAVARDAAGNEGSAATVSVTVFNDTTAPTVAITDPNPLGVVYSSSATVRATATDNVGIVSVQFFVDGVAIGAPVTGPPYEAQWFAGTFSEGWHVLTAVARDAAGNQTTSAPVSVKVD